MVLKTIPIRKGAKVTILAIATSAKGGGKDPCDTLKFCQKIKDTQPAELSKLVRLWDDIARDGPPSNDQKFKDLPGTNGLYEIKTTKLRVLCFWDEGSLIICTHGFIKTSNKTPLNELRRGHAAQKAYFYEKSKGTIRHSSHP